MTEFKKGDRVRIISLNETGTVSHAFNNGSNYVSVIPDNKSNFIPLPSKEFPIGPDEDVEVCVMCNPEDLELLGVVNNDPEWEDLWDSSSDPDRGSKT